MKEEYERENEMTGRWVNEKWKRMKVVARLWLNKEASGRQVMRGHCINNQYREMKMISLNPMYEVGGGMILMSKRNMYNQ
jgi:hypothetical protein